MIDHHEALVYTMVLVAAADSEMTDAELRTIGEVVKYLPIFADFDQDRLPRVASDCAGLLNSDDGLDHLLDAIAEALPARLIETAYVVACDVAAADGHLAQEELRLLEMIRHRLGVDRLPAAAIERAARARHAVL